MSVRTIKITYDGNDLIVPDQEFLTRYKPVLPCACEKFGYYTFTASASDVSEGFFIVTKAVMLEIISGIYYDTDAKGAATLKFESVDAGGSENNVDISIPNVYVGPRTMQLHATEVEALYVLHLVDQRYWSKTMMKTVTLEYNLVMPDGVSYQTGSQIIALRIDGQTVATGSTLTSPGSAFITDGVQPQTITLIAGAGADNGDWVVTAIPTETTMTVEGSFAETNSGITFVYVNPYKWSDIADKLFQEMNIVSTTGTLSVPTDDPKCDATDLQFPSIPASLALDLLVGLNGWTFVYNPFTTACTVEDQYAPASPIRTILAGLAERRIMGGITHVQYNYDTHDQPAADKNDKYIGSDLYSLPFNPAMTMAKTFKLLFPVRYQHGRYPSRRDDSTDSTQTIQSPKVINHQLFDAMTSPASDDFEDAFLPYIRTSSAMIWHDHCYAIKDKDAPFSTVNTTALGDRRDYMVLRFASLVVSPRGKIIYDGWHQIAPGPEVYRVSLGVMDGIPVTVVDLSYRPEPMFGAKWMNEAIGIGLTGTSINVAQRANADFFMHPNTALFPFFDNTVGLPT